MWDILYNPIAGHPIGYKYSPFWVLLLPLDSHELRHHQPHHVWAPQWQLQQGRAVPTHVCWQHITRNYAGNEVHRVPAKSSIKGNTILKENCENEIHILLNKNEFEIKSFKSENSKQYTEFNMRPVELVSLSRESMKDNF